MNGISISGALRYRKIHYTAPLSWRLRNALRVQYIWGWLTTVFAKAFSKITGIVTITTELRANVFHDGKWMDYGVVGRRVVTSAGVAYLVDAWQDTDHSPTDLCIMKYHGVGTGAVAEAVGDTGLGTECALQYDTDSTRPAGSLAEGSAANIFSSVGTVVFTYTGGATTAITEHGLFSANASGTLFDRTVFAAINVVTTDQIVFTYQATFNSGG
jgi:hypothetical protein